MEHLLTATLALNTTVATTTQKPAATVADQQHWQGKLEQWIIQEDGGATVPFLILGVL